MFTQLFLHKYDALWDRFFGPDIEPRVYNYSTYINSTDNFYVSEVSFYNFTNGVIRIDGKRDSKVLISKSFFCNSYYDGDGGSFYCDWSNSCIQYRVCSINSKISNTPESFGAHSCVETFQNNYIIESSISKSRGYQTCIKLRGINSLIDSTNISYAKCNRDAALMVRGYDTIRINFTSIFTNTADEQSVASIYSKDPDNYVYRWNFINNTVNSKIESAVVKTMCKRLRISCCVFSSNSGPYLIDFWLFLFIDHCFLDNPNVEKNFFGVSEFLSLNTTNQFVLNLRHLSTQQCVADFPIEFYPETSHIQNPYKNYDRLKLIPR